MAITVNEQISTQQATSTTTYCYLYEPLKIDISESISGVTQIFIDLVVYDTETGVEIDSEVEYGKYDISQNLTVEVDLSRLMQQYHEANVFKIGEISDISNNYDHTVSKYKYKFLIYSDVTATKTEVFKLPIIGGRDFYDFEGEVLQTQDLTEAELYEVDLTGRWNDYYNISTTLSSPTLTDSSPTITTSLESSADIVPCGGMLIWKSRFGGWMYWGMDIARITPKGSYKGNLTVGMFEATAAGSPYVQVNYTEIENSYSISLKALSLTNDELKSVAGIVNSPAVYYMRDPKARLELMRVTSASAPISTLIGGEDFTVELTNISTSSQKTR